MWGGGGVSGGTSELKVAEPVSLQLIRIVYSPGVGKFSVNLAESDVNAPLPRNSFEVPNGASGRSSQGPARVRGKGGRVV